MRNGVRTGGCAADGLHGLGPPPAQAVDLRHEHGHA